VKLKLDENLGRRAATMLRTAGFDVATVPEEGLCSASDQQLLEICRQEGRCLVTLDLGFGNPLRFPPASYPGIAVLQLPPRLSHTHLEAVLGTLDAALQQRTVAGKLWIVQVGRLREYIEERSPEHGEQA